MNISKSIPSSVHSISFSFLTSEDIRRISVKQIVNPVLLDELNRPNIGGLYDPALGPSDKKDVYVFESSFGKSQLSKLQMCNMSVDILHLPWPLWPHRTPLSRVSSAFHGQYVQATQRVLPVLP